MVRFSRLGRAHIRLHMRLAAAVAFATLVVVSLVAPFGCGGAASFLEDPLERARLAELGPEDPAVPMGPLHRPGQPCAACHRPGGVASVQTAAGTVYRDPVAKVPVADVVVALVDASGKTFTTRTNCVGSFYVKETEFLPTYPFWVSVQLGEFPYKMGSPIHSEASCAGCHFDPAGPSSAGHVFLTDDDTTFATIPLRACAAQDGISR